MTNYGEIKSYDGVKGNGMITPELGGEPLAFVKANLLNAATDPMPGQIFGYETQSVVGGRPQAIRLELDLKRDQARQQRG